MSSQAPTPVLTIIPLGDRVLLRPIVAQKRGGIFIPDTEGDDHPTQLCEVVAQPALRKYEDGSVGQPASDLKVGDRVYIAKFTGWKITSAGEGDEELIVVETKDVLAIECPAPSAEFLPGLGDPIR